MRVAKGLRLFAVYVAGAAIFVWITSHRLPDLVASHFGASGAANGFMTRTFYLAFMEAIVVGLPVLTVLVTWRAVGSPRARLNLPNRDYWLASERRAGTIAYLQLSILWFSALLVAFLCYVHALVVLANNAQPIHLSGPGFVGGLMAYAVVLFVAVRAFVGRFRRVA